MSDKPIIAILGMGTIGLTIAKTFGKVYKLIGFDINRDYIAKLKKNKKIGIKNINFTHNPEEISLAKIYIVAVPTLVKKNNQPNYENLLTATRTIGKYLKRNDLVIYESSVAPGTTENYCLPILEATSKLKSPKDFAIGFCPERVNPGDLIHTENNITKIVSAQNEENLKKIIKLYEKVIDAKIVAVSSIKIAEACKIIENTLRDAEIAIINEIAIFLKNININFNEVINAMSTKWNYIPIKPGLVGGHCIGINTYYLLELAKKNKIQLPLVKLARNTNENMHCNIFKIIKSHLKQNKISMSHAVIGIMGVTFKANYCSLDHTGAESLIKLLKKNKLQILLHDPIAKKKEVTQMFGIELQPLKNMKNIDVLVILIEHKEYISWPKNKVLKFLKPSGCIIDLKGTIK